MLTVTFISIRYVGIGGHEELAETKRLERANV
jgi:hypothetical protein